MIGLRVLVVDDHPRWREELAKILRRLERDVNGREARVDTADSKNPARERLASVAYDLAVVDLALLGDPPDPRKADEEGFDLLQEIRASALQRRCGVIVVTGTATSERIHRALQDFGVKKVVIKPEFDDRDHPDEYLLGLAREAILEARVRGTAERRASRPYLTLTFDSNGWVEGDLQSLAGRNRYRLPQPVPFDTENLVRRADAINRMLLDEAAHTSWRAEMSDIGGTLFRILADAPKLYDKWASARLLVRQRGDLWLRFRGPAKGLGVPLDLLREHEEYLCLLHILSREVEREGLAPRLDPFSEFIGKLVAQRLPLRVLLVAANTDKRIPAVDEEVAHLKDEMIADLLRMGVRCEPTVLTSEQATYGRVKEELRSGRHHLFHYAGHGRHDANHPEGSGLILAEGAEERALTANDLSLIAGPDLQLVFLSCCLGAVNKSRPSSDEFCGIFQALALANVPTVVGHRWVIPDDTALLCASTFYSHLWRTLCPGEALLEARREAAMGEWGRDDHTWAAPVLLMQSP